MTGELRQNIIGRFKLVFERPCKMPPASIRSQLGWLECLVEDGKTSWQEIAKTLSDTYVLEANFALCENDQEFGKVIAEFFDEVIKSLTPADDTETEME